jgi:hypothetical protein
VQPGAWRKWYLGMSFVIWTLSSQLHFDILFCLSAPDCCFFWLTYLQIPIGIIRGLQSSILKFLTTSSIYFSWLKHTSISLWITFIPNNPVILLLSVLSDHPNLLYPFLDQFHELFVAHDEYIINIHFQHHDYFLFASHNT